MKGHTDGRTDGMIDGKRSIYMIDGKRSIYRTNLGGFKKQAAFTYL